MTKRLISFDDEAEDHGLPEPVVARLDARYGGAGGGGGAALVPDPVHDGFFIVQAGSPLIPDPDTPGLFLIGA